MWVDTHAHLNMDVFDRERKGVIQRAEEVGVGMIVDVGTDAKSSRKAVENSEEYDIVWAAVGVHPHDAGEMKTREFFEIERLLDHPKVVAVGEIGLDYHYDFSPREIQRSVFRRQLSLATERNFPVIIHVREAMGEALSIVSDLKGAFPRGVFHCFSGTGEEVSEILGKDFFISFTGVVTFKNFARWDVVRSIPLEKLLLETDAPYMAPVPCRGRQNEPAFLIHTAKVLAGVYGMEMEELAHITTSNAKTLFKRNG